MGSINEAEDAHTRLVYALEGLSTGVAAHPALAERVVREAECLGLVKGAPRVVTLVDWGRREDERGRETAALVRRAGARGGGPTPRPAALLRSAP
ncbi:MAG TPA: hypothetical protein VFS43_07180 [Polyangiaceae bacterium]|nr:hypothetical protein [Polyangiaceae bacterium]